MKVWDFNGKYIKELGTNTESTYFVDCWYNKKNESHYIINANSVDVKSYVFKTGLLYKTYKTSPSNWHMSAVVNQLPEVTHLIESDGSGTVRIWDFHTAILLKTVSLVSGYNLRGICLWNDRYLFGAGSDCHIKLFDLKANTFLKDFSSHTKTACSIQKINHPQYGECFITHALDGKLKLWGKSSSI
jgi:WD40 repeat protein